jgi:3-deoxy-manno-octulosonate cytidylyltransferase (CMP-KDO synthetase)
MKIVAVIPARYASTRFPGKPLADICGKPMLWWVHRQLKMVGGIDEVYIACDDERILEVCEKYGIPSVMTSDSHPTHLDRLAEFARKVDADFYINVNGDEPLMKPEYVEKLLPDSSEDPSGFYFANAMTLIKKPVEVVDTARIKIVTDTQGYAMYMARTPVPYPKGTAGFEYKKFVGIQCATKSALLFCGQTPRGPVESIEDIDEYRLLENGKKIKFVMVEAETLSVDTRKDLAKVIEIIKAREAES